MSLCPNLKVIGTGLIASMAVPIFLVGSHRVIGPNTRIFLHEIGTSVSKDTRYSISEVRKILAELESHTDRYVEFVSKRTAGKMSTDLIRELMLNDSYLSAQQALEYGLAHQIIDQ
jgi:ATP-dependent protease ClpP protease subunit